VIFNLTIQSSKYRINIGSLHCSIKLFTNHSIKSLNSKFTSAVNSTVRSLIGVVDKDVDTSGILRLGPIPSTNCAICAIEEIGRMSYEDQGFLLTALQHGTI